MAEQFTSIYSYRTDKSLLYRFNEQSNKWWNYFQNAGTLTAVFDNHQVKLEELHTLLISKEYEINLKSMSIKMSLIRELSWRTILHKNMVSDVIVIPEIIENIVVHLKNLF